MATPNFPTSLPSIADMTASHTLAADSHAAKHNQLSAESTALGTKIGIGASTPVASTILRGTGAGTSSWSQVVLTTDVSGILPTTNGGNGTTSTTGSGSAVFGTAPTISTPTITGGGSWAGSPSISSPTIADFTNSTHTHQNNAGGGVLAAAAIGSFNTSLTAISNPYKFFAFQSSVQTLSSSSATKVSFQTEVYDTNNNFDTATNNRYTAPVTGFYDFDVKVGDVVAASATFQLFLYKNGSKLIGSQNSNSPAGTRIVCQDINVRIPLTAGDYVEIFIAGTNGDTLCATAAYDAGNELFTYFCGALYSHT